jgi:hypothetical protein
MVRDRQQPLAGENMANSTEMIATVHRETANGPESRWERLQIIDEYTVFPGSVSVEARSTEEESPYPRAEVWLSLAADTGMPGNEQPVWASAGDPDEAENEPEDDDYDDDDDEEDWDDDEDDDDDDDWDDEDDDDDDADEEDWDEEDD